MNPPESGMPLKPQLSVVVPVLNEAENIPPLLDGVVAALGDQLTWELILVDDGSTDETANVARECGAADTRIRLVSLARRYGQSTAMQAGFDHARGHVLVTMDGDLQNDPGDIPTMVAKLNEGYDLVVGYRERRKDRLVTRKIPSWIANRIIAWLTGVPIRDNGCSLKAYRADLLTRMRLYSDMHRFIPALAAGTAGARIAQIPVRHHPRTRGVSKYGLSRIGKVLADLFTIKMIRSFRMRPLLLFATGAGAATALALAAAALWLLSLTGLGVQRAATTIVFPGSVLLLLALAVYLLLLGLVGEVALRTHRRHGLKAFPLVREGRAHG
jgi:hypothetical protein